MTRRRSLESVPWYKPGHFAPPEASVQCTRVRFFPARLTVFYEDFPPYATAFCEGGSNPGTTCLPGAEQNCTQVHFFLSKLVEASAACQEQRSKMYPGTGTLGKETPPILYIYRTEMAFSSRRHGKKYGGGDRSHSPLLYKHTTSIVEV